MLATQVLSGVLGLHQIREVIKIPVQESEVRVVEDEPHLRPGVILDGEVTAYTSSPEETDDDPFITASGERVGKGTAACPSRYSFGTEIVIEGKTYRCQDRMNSRYRETNRFDIWMESKDEAYEWGIKELQIEVKNNTHNVPK